MRVAPTIHEKMMIRMVQRLRAAFKQTNERHQLVWALRAFSKFMSDLELPNEWRRKIYRLQLALAELDDGIVPKVLQPKPRSDSGRPGDEWQVWRARGCALHALKARQRSGMKQREAVSNLKRCYPTLNKLPYLKGESLGTSLRNWARRLDGVDIKRGDHLDAVVAEYLDTKKLLSSLPPQQAVVAANALLQNVLH
jgi:hypothetical protein